ncbi:MAG: hypothetical protein V4717_14715 [Bacteroidota bacterium]
MKRLITIILAILYMGTSIGATMHMHYCMGKLAAWSFSFNKSDACPKCGMEKAVTKAKGCCSDEQKTFKASTDQKVANLSFQAIYSIAAAIPSDFVDAPANRVISITEANPLSKGPPLANSIAIYIRNRVFLI